MPNTSARAVVLGTFGCYAAEEVGYYLRRRLDLMAWRTYADLHAWKHAVNDHELRMLTLGALDTVAA